MPLRLKAAAVIIWLAAIHFLWSAAGSSASTITVPGQYSSIQAAINSSGPGDTIQVASGTFNEKIYIINRSNLTISGAGSLQTIVVNRYRRSDDVPAVYVENSTGIHISGICLKKGDTGLVVTGNSTVTVNSSSIKGFKSGGVFVGEILCAPLPTRSLKVPQCYLGDRLRYVDSSRLEIYDTTVAGNGVRGTRGPGLAFFPGTTGYIRNSVINRNKLTGLFIWGARVDVTGSAFKRNAEHAIEYRQYPSPKINTGLVIRAGGILIDNIFKNSRPLPDGRLGGGLVTQGADIVLTGNLIAGNRAWGISACRGSTLVMDVNTIINNRKAGIIVQRKSRAFIRQGNIISGNGYEGLVAQGNSYVEMASSVIQYNGRFGALFQKRTEGRLSDNLIRGNGRADGYYGGVAYARNSWGSVTASNIRGHLNGPGIHFYGGPDELLVEGNEIAGNKRSGVVFESIDANGNIIGNTFLRGNTPFDVACPDGGSPSLIGPQGNKIDGRCPDIP